ncbi:hypothetical protein LJ737_20770 [Hymenobacter sp. 15J16-1T3B]|uniref:hypothetical protein n=1 Tax=Hymenobacter sp. 15J16-1T3B TaxID=2886941 RepID=UPI001D10EE99|nr:hypothetical protein [Hymenobacter sp. 15J16-1T3B]MCC3159687.1 hypothetical protein [Hymenobacter sp. 15J16-1T3B]
MAQTKEEKLEAKVAELEKELAAERERSDQHVEAYGKSQEDLSRAQEALAAEQQAHEATKAELASRSQGVVLSTEGPAKAPGTLYVNGEGVERYFTDETVKVAGTQGMKGWNKATDKPQPLKD